MNPAMNPAASPAMPETVEVVGFWARREGLVAEKDPGAPGLPAAPELKGLFGLRELPLAPTYISVEIRGVSTAAVNALRRSLLDEMEGKALKVPGGFGPGTTEKLMLPQFVCERIHHLPLRPQIPPEVADRLRLRLDVTNGSGRDLIVYSGDLVAEGGEMPYPLFNPTFRLGFLQPGKRLVIEGIQVATGYGRDDAAYMVARQASYTHLDLERYSDADIREEEGAAVDMSGYRVSSLVANPRHHRLSAVLPATGPDPAVAKAVVADACAGIKERLRLVAMAVGNPARGGKEKPVAARGVQFTVFQVESGLAEGVLRIPGETHTIGELLRRTVYDLEPGVASVTYTVAAHENQMTLVVRHSEDVARLLARAAQAAIEIFDAIQRGVAAAPVR